MRRFSFIRILAPVLAVGLTLLLAPGVASALDQSVDNAGPDESGKLLFQDGCSTCHGLGAEGIDGVAPDLRGVGARAADFYLSTGRMPLSHSGAEPVRSPPRYPAHDIDRIVAYIASFGGPPIPEVDLADGDIEKGFEAFSEHCAGCHQAVAKGGIVPGAFAPNLDESTPTQVAQAVRIGPYLMPKFSRRVIDDHTLNSIALYVEQTKHPDNSGGWAIGNLGPIPEGMIAWLLALVLLLVVARLIGDRNRDGDSEEPPTEGDSQ